MRPDDLIAPNSVTGLWGVALNPYKEGVANEVSMFVQSCLRDHSFWKSLHPLLKALKSRTDGE
eukprot:5863661-Pyramimonas_sp.AAC.1